MYDMIDDFDEEILKSLSLIIFVCGKIVESFVVWKNKMEILFDKRSIL